MSVLRVSRALLAMGVAVAVIAFSVWWVSPAAPTPEPGTSKASRAPSGEGHESGEEHAEGKAIALSPEQRREAGIAIDVVAMAPLPKLYRAPGEVRSNDYTTNSVTARHAGVVTERKAKLGDKVTKGQPLVTLFSAEMAETQSDYILAAQEYARVHKLSPDFVPRRRIEEADAKQRETRAKLETFGLASNQIDALIAGRSEHPAGQFDIVAPQDGTIIEDDFRLGAVVDAGKLLFVIADPGVVWVEAHVSPAIAAEVSGDNAKIHIGTKVITGQVIQVQQKIDEATRTVGVRLQASNADGALKPGLFVDVELYGKAEQVVSLPTDAVVRGPDGDWTVYVENAKGDLEAKEVKPLYSVGSRTVVADLPVGTRVVTRGAFFVMAEAAKGGFDPHNH